MSLHLHRRALLQSLGLAGGAYFLPSVVRPRGARAAAAPKRFVVFYTGHGTLPQFFAPKGIGGAAPTETAWDFGEINAPLAPFKSDVITMSGLDLRSADFIPSTVACGHAYGQVHSLTSNGQDGKAQFMPLSPSIDQVIVEGLKKNNNGTYPTRVPSLAVAFVSDGNNYFPGIFATGRSSPVTIETKTDRAFERLFPAAQKPTTPADDPAAKRKLVLDAVLGDIGAVKPRLGAAERQRLDQHASFITDLEKSLVNAPATTCAPPENPGALTTWAASTTAMTKMVQAALACDVTRVVGIAVNGVPDSLWGFKAGDFGMPSSHELFHQTDRDGSLRNNADAVATAKRFHIENAKLFAALLQALKDVKEPDGRTLLDSTAVLWAGELAEGNHGLHNMHWQLAGSCGGAFKTGRYLSFGDPNRSEWTADKTQPSNADLFLSIAQAMDVPLTTFGDPRACSGPIARLAG